MCDLTINLIVTFLFLGQLLKTAEKKEDSSILLHIKDKDCVSLEVRYHRSCYKAYTMSSTKSTATTEV